MAKCHRRGEAQVFWPSFSHHDLVNSHLAVLRPVVKKAPPVAQEQCLGLKTQKFVVLITLHAEAAFCWTSDSELHFYWMDENQTCLNFLCVMQNLRKPTARQEILACKICRGF